MWTTSRIWSKIHLHGRCARYEPCLLLCPHAMTRENSVRKVAERPAFQFQKWKQLRTMFSALWLSHINSGSKATRTWSWPLILICSCEERKKPYESTHSTALSSCYASHSSGLAVLFIWMLVVITFTSDKSYGIVDTEYGTGYSDLRTVSRSRMRWDLSSGTQCLHCLLLYRHTIRTFVSWVVKTTQPWNKLVRSESTLMAGKSVQVFHLSPHSKKSRCSFDCEMNLWE